MRLALIDYRAGNLTSVRKALTTVGADVFSPDRADELHEADGIVVPGVGHFAATAALDGTWRETIADRVRAGRPLLGICLGLQWLFDASDEAADLPGLGMLAGRCHLLSPGAQTSPAGSRLKVPHVGWNALATVRESRLLAGVSSGEQAYFTHSYVAPVTGDTVATTEHGEVFAAVVERGRIFGAQFHPEKSGDVGLRMLANFLAVTREA